MSVDGLLEYDKGKMYDEQGRTCLPNGVIDKLNLEPEEKIGFVYRDGEVVMVNLSKEME